MLRARLGSVGNGSWILSGSAEQLPEGQDGALGLAALAVEELDQGLAVLGDALHPLLPHSPHSTGTSPGCSPRDAAAS